MLLPGDGIACRIGRQTPGPGHCIQLAWAKRMRGIEWAYAKRVQASAYSEILDPVGPRLYTLLATRMWRMGIDIPGLMQVSGIPPGTRENKQFQGAMMH